MSGGLTQAGWTQPFHLAPTAARRETVLDTVLP